MCLTPIYIWQNSSNINAKNVKVKIAVPCGKCAECLATRATNYKVRAYFEALECHANNGVSLFDTLTYADQFLPRSPEGIPCFNHSDIEKFIKRLRSRLHSHGYTCRFRVFVVSEFGHTTHRPHYHLLIFYHGSGLSASQLHSYLHACWKYGFTDKQIKQVNIANRGLGAIHYVTKYMVKDSVEVADLKTFEKMTSLPKNITTYTQYLDAVKKRKKMFALRNYQSNGFGSYFLTLLFNDPATYDYFEKTHGCIKMPNAKSAKRGAYSAIPLSHYYNYKIFYDRVYNPTTGRKDKFVLNDYGIQNKLQKYDDILRKTEDKLCEGYARSKYKSKIDSLLHGYSLHNLSVYYFNYRLTMTDELNIDLEDGFSYYERCLTEPKQTENPLRSADRDFYKKSFTNAILATYDDLFRDFDIALTFILEGLALVNLEKQAIFDKKNTDYHILRQFNKLNTEQITL